jgi:hypothetical protein
VKFIFLSEKQRRGRGFTRPQTYINLSPRRVKQRVDSKTLDCATSPAMATEAQRLLQVSTKIIGVSTNYMVHVKEPGNVPKVR